MNRKILSEKSNKSKIRRTWFIKNEFDLKSNVIEFVKMQNIRLKIFWIFITFGMLFQQVFFEIKSYRSRWEVDIFLKESIKSNWIYHKSKLFFLKSMILSLLSNLLKTESFCLKIEIIKFAANQNFIFEFLCFLMLIH